MADDQKQQEETKSEDNLNMIDVLDDFNKGSSEEPQTEEAQTEESNVETQPEEAIDNTKEDVQWLIDNKFKNDDEGRENLAKSYRELQSKYDKDSNRSKEDQEKFDRLEKLDGFLQENPEVVKTMKEKVDTIAKAESGPPKKPEDYDILDESIDDTSSATWRGEYDNSLITQGQKAAKEELNSYKAELDAAKQQAEEVGKLKEMGLSDEEIPDYYNFVTADANLTTENLVKIYRYLKVDDSNTDSGTTQQPVPTKRTSAAAATGSTPPAKNSDKKEVEQFWDGIMKFNR